MSRRLRRLRTPAGLVAAAAALSALALSPMHASADAPPQPAVGGQSSLGFPTTGSAANADAIATVSSNTGAASVTLPFALNAARGAVQPGLALRYSSTAGNGDAGFGWSLGLESIERRNLSGPPRYLDPQTDGQPLDPKLEDRFEFAGAPLVPICLIPSTQCPAGETFPDWANGGWHYFRLEHEGLFARFFWSPDRTYWRVQFKSGETMELGNVPGLENAGGVDVDQICDRYGVVSCQSVIDRWRVVQRYDAHGTTNAIRYRWDHPFDGPGVLTDIYDTPALDGTLSPAGFAHHAHLTYGPHDYPRVSAAAVWHATPPVRLAMVDVTSKSFEATGPRELVRRYRLSYTTDGHRSLLSAFQMEGRCPGAVTEDETGALPAETGCPRLPRTTFQYATPSPAFPPGFVTISGVPEGIPFDLNSDGVADILSWPKVSPTNPPTHVDAYVNGAFNNIGTFAYFQVVSPATTSLFTESATPGDWSGNGRMNLLVDNNGDDTRPSFLLSPRFTSPTWTFDAMPIPPPAQPLRRAASPLSTGWTGDVDGDGLVDALGVYARPAFTLRDVASPKIRPFSRERYQKCVPNGEYQDATLGFPDMNGDGLPDLLAIDPSTHALRYWPGDGTGRFSASPSTCDAWDPATFITMVGKQIDTPAHVHYFLHDVTGDGLADLVYQGNGYIEVTPNVDGLSFGVPFTIDYGPVSSDPQSLAFADMNGSGTDDIIVFQGGQLLGYVDMFPNGPAHRDLLTVVTNGASTTTTFEYLTTTELARRAAADGHPWTTKSPQVMQAVARVLRRSFFPGRQQVIEEAYTYRDPAYDGWLRRFLGFRSVRVARIGDTTAPTSFNDTTYFYGAHTYDLCQDLTQACAPQYVDNPNDGLRGAPIVSEQSDENGSYLTTTHTTYLVNQLMIGMDGRAVLFSAPEAVDTFHYDVSPFQKGEHTVALLDVEGALLSSRDVTIRSPVSRHLRTFQNFDTAGNVTESIDEGEVIPGGQQIETFTTWKLTSNPSQWQWRLTDVLSPRAAHYDYNAYGELTDVTAPLTGTVPLLRRHEGTGATAPLPPNASHDGAIHLEHRDYDAYGNVTQVTGPIASASAQRCAQTSYDPTYAHLPVSATLFSGGCGKGPLTTIQHFDRGLARLDSAIDATGAFSTISFDPYGRVIAAYEPDPLFGGVTSSAPSMKIEYFEQQDNPVRRVHSQTIDHGAYRNTWSYLDGYGATQATITEADTAAGDQGPWVVNGLSAQNRKGMVVRRYQPSFYKGDPAAYPLDAPVTQPFVSVRYDAFDRPVASFALDGAQVASRIYHALADDAYDARDLASSTPTPASRFFDGHMRVATVARRVHVAGRLDTILTNYSYQKTGEVTRIERRHTLAPGDVVARTMRYDSLGRLVENLEPNTSTTGVDGTLRDWKYAYDDANQLVGTVDARGCGTNLFYDALGRTVAKDYSPCLNSQPDYTAPDLASGDGTESFYRYDAPEVTGRTANAPASGVNRPVPPPPINPAFYLGRLGAAYDRGAHTRFTYDGRGRLGATQRQIAKPGVPSPSLTARYAPWWYSTESTFDDANRVVRQSTGADVQELLGTVDGRSDVTFAYSARGAVTQIGGSYGPLVAGSQLDADGALLSQTLGDAAHTSLSLTYDGRRRLQTSTIARAAPSFWSPGGTRTGYIPPPQGTPSTLQTVLEDVSIGYDAVDNPISIVDRRPRDQWPVGAQPISRALQYDELDRLTRVDYDSRGDAQVSPFAAENATGSTAPVPQQSILTRVRWQTFGYDWQGNTTLTVDDQHAFYDRSLGVIQNGSTHPNQLAGARSTEIQPNRCPPGGCPPPTDYLRTSYDDAGNLTDLLVTRDDACSDPDGKCTQRFVYDWDEVGNLARARRWDYAGAAGVAFPGAPSGAANADLTYAYGGGSRVLKTSTTTAADGTASQVHTAEIFGSLRLNHARFDLAVGDYERTALTEAVYLAGVGRVFYAATDLPHLTSGTPYVFLEMGDHIGSTSIVIDQATSELVERSTYDAYGAPETDYRPDRWGSFREDYRFTGKEDDIEVGLTYFGARYYHAALGRWISPDPLTIHAGGANLNPYAYVGGSPMAYTDAFGLCGGAEDPCPTPPSTSGGGDTGGDMGWGAGPDGDNCHGECHTPVVSHGVYRPPPPVPYAPLPPGTVRYYLGNASLSGGGFAYGLFTPEGITGFLYGTLQGLTPGGPLLDLVIGSPAPSSSDGTFQFWQLGGQFFGAPFSSSTSEANLAFLATNESAPRIVRIAAAPMGGVLSLGGAVMNMMGAKGGGPSAESGSSGSAGDDYRGRYQASQRAQGKPELPDSWDAHHRIPQEYDGHPELKNFDFHDPSNLRGVSGSRNPGFNVHQAITNHWNAFRRTFPNAKRAQIEGFANWIDSVYGSTYW